jgi:hypothetical protein
LAAFCLSKDQHSVSYYAISRSMYRMILDYCQVSMTYNFQTGKSKIKLLTKYESVTQKSYIRQRCCRRTDVWRTLSWSVSSYILLLPVWIIYTKETWQQFRIIVCIISVQVTGYWHILHSVWNTMKYRKHHCINHKYMKCYIVRMMIYPYTTQFGRSVLTFLRSRRARYACTLKPQLNKVNQIRSASVKSCHEILN